MILKGQFYITRKKDLGAFSSTEGSLHCNFKISQILTENKLLNTLNAGFYSSFLAMKQILFTNTEGGLNVLKHR